MGAVDGRQFIRRLDLTPREVWCGDQKITGSVSEHPAFKGVAKSIVALYDMQMKPALIDSMTYRSPSTGDRVGISFLQPRTKEDLARRAAMMRAWADYSG